MNGLSYYFFKTLEIQDPPFSKAFKVIKQDKDYPKFILKYPQISSKTKNGQTRLAHFIKTKLTRKDYEKKMHLFSKNVLHPNSITTFPKP